MHDVSTEPSGRRRFEGIFGPWWASLIVLALLGSGLVTRGMDFSSPWDGFVSVAIVLGLGLAVIVVLVHLGRKLRDGSRAEDSQP